MGAPPLLVRISKPQNMSFLFNRQSFDHRTSDDFSRLAHPRQTYYCQTPQMVQPISSFQTVIFFPFTATHCILDHFIIGKGWPLREL